MGLAIGPARDSRSTRGWVSSEGGLRTRIWPKELGRGTCPDLAEVKISPMQVVSVATTLIEREALDASTLPDGSHLPPEEA
jgi:hypothetical protein